jgi:dephospho-CoA kinase
MLRVGLTGGLATGKSFVGRCLQDVGGDECLLIQADDLGRKVQEQGGAAYDAIAGEFGPGILNADGSIDRRKLAGEVFADPERLATLSRIVHPHVHALRRELEREFATRHPHGISVTEAAILVETGTYRDYDRLIVVTCRPEQQVERAMSRDRLTREEVLDRMRQQMPLEEKLKVADFIVDTSGSKENTLAQTRTVYDSLRTLEQSARSLRK